VTRLQSNQKKIVTMSDLAERPPRVGVKRALLRWSVQFERIRAPLLRYGLSVVGCAIATGIALVCQSHGIRGVYVGLLCLPVAMATWFGGAGPSVLAVLLCMASFNYFFLEPLYTFYVTL
jgi:K+-sensing histidine kinase KdpD